ncbi:hypothetical protein HMPREF1022_00525 [Desulfovibrio sp. 6_1_46AFAA]|nr:hypothetical protein HMPREF1022_00525 [Desulfovibrio sp. 6_1_46AFAA]
MDLEDQWKIAKLVERHGRSDLLVLLGCPDAESSQIQAETVTLGDPSMVGSLTASRHFLEVYHLVEPEVRQAVPHAVYARYIGEYAAKLDTDSLLKRMRDVRALVATTGETP